MKINVLLIEEIINKNILIKIAPKYLEKRE